MRIDIEVQPPATTVLISQPPASDSFLEASMVHYTWGCEVLSTPGDNDSVVWRWDKRRYTGAEESFNVPLLPAPPESLYAHGNYTLIFPGGKVFSRKLGETMATEIRIMNEAIEKLPELEPCGWFDLPECDDSGRPIPGSKW